MSARPENVIADALHMPRYWLDDVCFKLPSAILAALRAAGFVIEQDWQPIETAPRDCPVLRWCPENDDSPAEAHVMQWYEQADTWMVYGIGGFEPTHWRPLPTPPEGQP